MIYSPQDIKQGLDLKAQAEEQPTNFGILDGATERDATGVIGKARMAGPAGARAAAMMNDPVEQERTANWMRMFGMSNQGAEFNQARMMMANPQPQQEQT
tara:strand:- start:124 stop:423 length:300 start_codon:yes stop_codon:yes gene_type:complete